MSSMQTVRRRAAVLGSPIAHSLSPALHRAAYAELGLDWTYDAIEVGEGGLADFLAGLDDTWAGFSVTMPLKPEALDLARMRSSVAGEADGANTLLPLGVGWSAENTDVPGLVAALDEAAVPRVGSAAVLGTGATAWSAVVALRRRGVVDLTLSARNAERAERLRTGGLLGVPTRVLAWGDRRALEAPLVIATVPKGASDLFVAQVPSNPGVLFDVVYDPWPTPLAAAWAERGGTVIGGLDLLVHQAVLQVELMTGRSPSVAALRAAGLAELAAR